MIALATIALWWFLQTQPATPCQGQPVANIKHKCTMQDAPKILAQTPLKVKLTEKQVSLFWSKVEKTDGCWLWKGCLEKDGYGVFSAGNHKQQKRQFRSHRIAYCLANGVEEVDGLILHSCDVRNCVAPHHLSIGTPKDNSSDMRNRGRSVRGEKHYRAVLKATDIPKIRALRLLGETYAQIGARFGAAEPTICHIFSGKTWKHVT